MIHFVKFCKIWFIILRNSDYSARPLYFNLIAHYIIPHFYCQTELQKVVYFLGTWEIWETSSGMKIFHAMALQTTSILSREKRAKIQICLSFEIIIVDTCPGRSISVTRLISRRKFSNLALLRVFIWHVISL